MFISLHSTYDLPRVPVVLNHLQEKITLARLRNSDIVEFLSLKKLAILLNDINV